MERIDCIIISTGRAASTAVYQYLDQAGDLALPLNKEPHYWCNVKKYKGLGKLLLEIYIDNKTDYFNLYSKSKMHLDASVGYFFCIDEVVEKLNRAGQKPKIIFLYREPVSRATSLFYEEKKKGMIKTDDVLSEIRTIKPEGLWWENYYDNVAYFNVFKVLEKNFNDILCINQAALQTCGNYVIDEILAFLGLEKIRSIQQLPVNSSAEAAIIIKLGWLRKLYSLPIPFKGVIKEKLIMLAGLLLKNNTPGEKKSELEKFLPFSLGEYRRFRSCINNADILLIDSAGSYTVRDCNENVTL